MKSFCIILLWLASSFPVAFAQVSEADSLKKLLAQTRQDTNRVLLLIELAGNYQFFKSDTAIILVRQAIDLAQKLNFQKGEIRAIITLGSVMEVRGEFPRALEEDLKALQLTRKNYDSEGEARCLIFTGLIYSELGEYRQALNYLFQAKKIYENILQQLPAFGVSKQFPPFGLCNIGDAYEKMNMLDSALYFQKQALIFPIELGKPLHSLILTRLGIIQSRLKNYSEALQYYHEALQLANVSGDLLNQNESQYQIAEIYSLQNNVDSSLYYAQLAFMNAQKASQKKDQLNASSLLTRLYKAKGNVDSAFYFQEAAMEAKDSLFGLDKFHQLQLLTLSEQQRVQQLQEEQASSKVQIQRTSLLLAVGVFLLIALLLWRTNRQQRQANRILNEKNLQIETQRNTLGKTLDELKSTQSQLIQSEKMASLGELTAGVAHEIQNPLNFVNNFSEVNKELLVEMKDEINKGNIDEVQAIANDIIDNEQKILHHGKRADAIVKGMLQHSRVSSGQKEPTDINALADEYLRLSYHGMRAKDKSFNATLQIDFDETIEKINIVPQDIGRVLLNLFNNAFYAVTEKKNALQSPKGEVTYEPTVSVCTKKVDSKVEIHVEDNGVGIPQKVVDKIFQPFFTTKPTGQGTGLGLSLSYDIVKAHGGEIKVETKEGEGAEFVIELLSNK